MDANVIYKATGLVMAGGAVGAALRFHATLMVVRLGHLGFPSGTLVVNVVGGLGMGVVAALVLHGHLAEGWRLLIAVGLLGGFTTFSAFSLELFQMLERGAYGVAAGYALLSVLLSLVALIAGFALTRVVS